MTITTPTTLHAFRSFRGNNRKKKKGHVDEWIPVGGAFYVDQINDRWAAGVSVS